MLIIMKHTAENGFERELTERGICPADTAKNEVQNKVAQKV